MILNQCIHGYSDGHRLLASSIALSKESEREIAILSDLSGNAGGEVFLPYLTAYPLHSDSLFAVAKTWPATEKKRPGCVWTHTLLLNEDDLAKMVNATGIISMFVRPSDDGAFDDFSKSLRARHTNVETIAHQEHITAGDLVEEILYALYEKLNPTVVVSLSEPIESLFTQVWLHRWGQARFGFSFCTMAINPRQVHGRDFYLQAVPNNQFRRSKWDRKNYFVIDEENPVSTENRPQWISDFSRTIRTGHKSHLFLLLKKFGPKCDPNMLSVRGLADLFSSLSSSDETNRLVDALESIAIQFPEANHAVELKSSVLSASGELRLEFLPSYRDIDYLQGLARLENTSAFASNQSDIRDLTLSAWHDAAVSEKDSILIFVIEHSNFDDAAEIIREIMSDLTLNEIKNVDIRSPGLVEQIVAHEPAVLANPNVWRARSFGASFLNKIQSELMSLPNDAAESVVEASLEARASYAAAPLTAAFGANAAIWCIRWISENGKSSRQDLASGWSKVVAEHVAQIVQFFSVSEQLSASSVSALLASIGSTSYRSPDISVWMEIVENLEPGPNQLDAPANAYLLSVGLSSSGDKAYSLIRYTYRSVYKSITASRMPESGWNALQGELPWIGFLESWDRAERLRRGLGIWLIHEDRPVVDLLDLIDDRFELKRHVWSMQRLNNGPIYLRNQWSVIKSKKKLRKMYDWQSEVLESSLRD